MVSDARIQQQLYTREKSGIFRTTEGYDTIARSPGLDPSLIKKAIHPLCGYDAPAELQAKAEKDASLYPSALQLVRLENRDIVLGQSVYVPTDFTGLRSAFFTHNYIIPSALGEDWVHHYDRWLNASFVDHYDLEQGSELPELDEFPVRSAGQNALAGDSASGNSSTSLSPAPHMQSIPPRALLDQLQIDDGMFRQLLGAVMSAIHRHRKVYISLNVPIAQLSDYARQLTSVIMLALPYAFRRRLGFTTYAKEPESRKGMQLLFVESGSIRAGDRNIERDYIFDLNSGRIQAAQAGRAGQLYIDWVCQHLDQPALLRELQQFADQGQAGLDAAEEALPDPAQYDEWTLLFRVEKGDLHLYAEQRPLVLQTLLRHLRPAGALTAAMRLNDLFLACFDREFDAVRDGQVPDVAIAEVFAEYYGIDPQHTGRKILEYFIRAIRNALSSGQVAESHALYAMMERQPPLYEAFISVVGSQPGLATVLLTPLIDRKFQQAQSVEEVITLAAEWGSKYPQLLDMDDYCNRAGQSFMEALRRSPDLLLATSNVFKQLERLESDQQPEMNSAAWVQSGLGDDMRASAERLLLSELDLKSLTRSRLLQADFLSYPLPSDEQPERAERRLIGKKRALQLLHFWFSGSGDETNEDVLQEMDNLPVAEKDIMQQLGRAWIGEDIRNGQFERLPAAFAYSAKPNDIDYAALVEEVRRHSPDEQNIYRFFNWSEGRAAFMVGEDVLDRPRASVGERSGTRKGNERIKGRTSGPRFVPAYETAILAYFRKHDREAFRRGSLAKDNWPQNKPALTAVYTRARDELATPFQKWMRRNRSRLPMLMGVLVVFIVGIVGLSIYFAHIFGGSEPVVTAPTTPEQQAPAINPNDLPNVLVTLSGTNGEDSDADTSTDSTTSDSSSSSDSADSATTGAATTGQTATGSDSNIVTAAASGTSSTGSSNSSSSTDGATSGSTSTPDSKSTAASERLVFHFKTMEPCTAFQPKKATLYLSGKQDVHYEKLDVQSSCASSTDTSGTMNNGNTGEQSSSTSDRTDTSATGATSDTSTSSTDSTDAEATGSKESTATGSDTSSSSSTSGDDSTSGESEPSTSAETEAPSSLTLTPEQMQQVYPYEVSLALPADTDVSLLDSITINGQTYIITTITTTS
ncbi:hypothetical protein [Paenibacillus sp. WLX2291]|uniref:GAP1-N2 domain-containing protein n=1 Tax=Paenibacillus sp. WLX2291 TaxID=3296934 RepID=UPI0039842FA2